MALAYDSRLPCSSACAAYSDAVTMPSWATRSARFTPLNARARS